VPIEAADKVGTIQAIGATWIKNLRVTMNGRETFNSNQLYAYKSYIDLELSYSREVKKSYLGVIGYFPDEEDKTDQESKNDKGYAARKALFAGGKSVQFFSRLNADIFSSDLLLINNVPIEIEIHPNDNDFLLLDLDKEANSPAYRLNISSVKMYAKFVELMDGFAQDIAARLARMPARYGIRRSELKSVFISPGRYEYQTNLFADQIPRRIIIGLIDKDAFNGHIEKSPFRFQNFDVREITIFTGTYTYPSVLYNMNWDERKNTYKRCYNDFMESVGLANSIETNGISPAHYKNGWCFFAFTLTADLENHQAFELIRGGTTSIMIRFNKPTPATGLTLLAYSEMDSLLMLDVHRNLTTDQTT
jgi:hypothetical protein